MWKLIELEWRKLEQKKVLGEVIVYWVILMFCPVFFLKVVFADFTIVDFGQSYSRAMPLMLSIQMGFVLFGASLINHVFIEEYKNKTMSLSYGYPLSRQKLVTAKVLFIFLTVFICTLVSFVLSGITTYVYDQIYDVINGQPNVADLVMYIARMILHSVIVALISLIPLFLFGIWMRAVIPTVICAIVLMNVPTFAGIIQITLRLDVLYVLLSLIGVLSVYVSVKMINQAGDI